VYRCFIEGLCGLQGVRDGLKVDPKMPSHWEEMKVTRSFRGATYKVAIKRADVEQVEATVDGTKIDGHVIKEVEKGKTYKVEVAVPRAK
jgi:cellobionic acid phosphorylase